MSQFPKCLQRLLLYSTFWLDQSWSIDLEIVSVVNSSQMCRFSERRGISFSSHKGILLCTGNRAIAWPFSLISLNFPSTLKMSCLGTEITEANSEPLLVKERKSDQQRSEALERAFYGHQTLLLPIRPIPVLRSTGQSPLLNLHMCIWIPILIIVVTVCRVCTLCWVFVEWHRKLALWPRYICKGLKGKKMRAEIFEH